MTLDQTDQNLLKLLEEDARKPATVLAEILGISRITLRKRMEALEKAGVIAGYTLRYGHTHEAKRFRVQALLKLDGNFNDVLKHDFTQCTQVTYIATISGSFDVSLNIEADSSEEIDNVLDSLRQHPRVQETVSHFILTTRFDKRAQ